MAIAVVMIRVLRGNTAKLYQGNAEVRGQISEVRSQRSEVRSQIAEVKPLAVVLLDPPTGFDL
jgi:hypothetical protein